MQARLFLAALVIAAALPAATIQTSFGANSEGWTVANDGVDTSVVHQPAGGNPGGAIERTDQTSTYGHFRAPAAFNGNLSAFYGGSLRYDLLQTVTSADSSWFYRTVLEGNGLLLLYTQELAPDTTNWRTLITPFTESGWIVIASLEDYVGTAATQGQFAGVLANLANLYITGDLISGQGDMTRLDNVALTDAPEPATWGITGLTLTLVAWARRRR